MMAMLAFTARSLRRTLDNIATPCSVKANGAALRPPQLEITNCDFKFRISAAVSWNIKSRGNRLILRLTAWTSTLGSTPYSVARSVLRITFWARIMWIFRSIGRTRAKGEALMRCGEDDCFLEALIRDRKSVV